MRARPPLHSNTPSTVRGVAVGSNSKHEVPRENLVSRAYHDTRYNDVENDFALSHVDLMHDLKCGSEVDG